MRLSKLTHLLYLFNIMLDSGKYDALTIEEIKEKLRDGTITDYLKSQYPNADFSLIEPEEWKYLTHFWNEQADITNERRKMGVSNRGVCLLVGYTIEAVQRHPDYPRNK